MRDNLTELVFILDRSGSMGGLEGDTIVGYNSFIEKQKAVAGEATLSTVLFDDKYELLHSRVGIRNVQPLTAKEYFVRGSTALLDAIGRKLAETPEADRPGKVLFVITTDGMENASKEYSVKKVREMIEHQKNKYSWEFLFLSANIDAIGTARDLGIGADKAAQYCCDSDGIHYMYKKVSAAVSNYRKEKTITEQWKEKIEEDYKKRGQNNDN